MNANELISLKIKWALAPQLKRTSSTYKIKKVLLRAR